MTNEPRPPGPSDERPAATTATASPRVREPSADVLVSVLRQVASAVSAYRLYGGDVRQPAFLQAAGRVRDATRRALEHMDLIDVEIRRGHFFGPTRPLPRDDMIDRLAQACFDRRVE